ncbi:MAG: ATP-binding protein, partial [Hyphomicrobium sp.]
RDILGTAPPARPLVQQQSTTSRNTGLTISRVVVEAHEGKMSLRSTMGEGTLVRLTLPKKRMSALGVAGPAAQELTAVAALGSPMHARPAVTGVPILLT